MRAVFVVAVFLLLSSPVQAAAVPAIQGAVVIDFCAQVKIDGQEHFTPFAVDVK